MWRRWTTSGPQILLFQDMEEIMAEMADNAPKMPPVNGNFGEPVNIVGNTGSGFYYMYI